MSNSREVASNHCLTYPCLMWDLPFLAKGSLRKSLLNTSQEGPTALMAKLDAYLEEEYFDKSSKIFDILACWKENAEKYRMLSAMARDLLDVPLSIVSSESVFSSGVRSPGNAQTSMKPKML